MAARPKTSDAKAAAKAMGSLDKSVPLEKLKQELPATEPDYLAQNGDIDSPEKLEAWRAKTMKNAQERGIKHVRVTQMNPAQLGGAGGRIFLFEGWKERPANMGDPRFQLTSRAPKIAPE